MSNRCRIVASALLSVFVATASWAGEPTEQLRGSVDRVIALLAPGSAPPTQVRATIRQIAGDMFDFNEMAQRSLGQHWLLRTPAEREEFASLFADLLERSYASKIELYGGEKISYVGETLDGDRATVRTTILSKQGNPIPVDYRMLLEASRWRVWDVTIDGVSLVTNYRTQFNTIIQKSSYAELVKRMRTIRERPVQDTKAAPAS
jgi:phospholipid transport system substrate-binding protein